MVFCFRGLWEPSLGSGSLLASQVLGGAQSLMQPCSSWAAEQHWKLRCDARASIFAVVLRSVVCFSPVIEVGLSLLKDGQTPPPPHPSCTAQIMAATVGSGLPASCFRVVRHCHHRALDNIGTDKFARQCFPCAVCATNFSLRVSR